MNSLLRPISIFVLTLLVTLSFTQVEAADRKLSFGVSGIVAALKVRPGDSVKTGTVLAVLDMVPFKARQRSAAAAAKSAKLHFDQTEEKLTLTRELFDSLSTSQEQVELAEIAHANAQAAYEKAKSTAEIASWRLQRASLKAPFAGKVRAVPGYPGMVVNADGENPAVVVVNTP